MTSTVSRVVLADGLKSISRMMFSECKKLVDVTIPASVTSIGDSAFAGCQSLSDILVPKSVTKIGPSAFAFYTTIHCIAKSSAQKWAEQNGLKYEIYKPVTKITFDTNMITPAIGTTMQLTPGFVPEDASNTNVVWSSDNPDIATVSEDGVVSAVANGKCKINAVAADGSGVKATINVSVIVPVGAVTLDQTEVAINKGKSLKLNAEVGPAEATNKKVTWSTSDASIATVNNGSVSAKACGECDIICEAADGSGVKSMCHVNVIQMVTSLTAKPPKLTIPYGGTSSEVEVKIVPEVVTNPVLVWSSSDESICSVDENGVITAVGAGDCEISCATTDDSDKVAVIKVHVPVFAVSETSVTVTEKDGMLIPVDLHGVSSSLITHKASSDANFLYYFDDEGIHVFPIKAGSATITLTDSMHKTDSAKYVVTVDPSAVYDPASGEEEPLRAFVVIDKNVIRPGDSVNAKYYVTGGKTPYIQCDFHDVSCARNISERSWTTTKVKSLPSGSQKFSFNDKYSYSFYIELYVVDANGNSVTVQSNIATVEHLVFSPDYYYYAIRKDQPFKMDYQINGGSGNYHVKATATLFYENGNTVDSVPVSEGNIGHDGTLEYSIPGNGAGLIQVDIKLECQDLKDKKLSVIYSTVPMVVTDTWSLKVGFDRDTVNVGESVTAMLYIDGNDTSVIQYADWFDAVDSVSAKYVSVDSGVWSTTYKPNRSGYVFFGLSIKDAVWSAGSSSYIIVR